MRRPTARVDVITLAHEGSLLIDLVSGGKTAQPSLSRDDPSPGPCYSGTHVRYWLR